MPYPSNDPPSDSTYNVIGSELLQFIQRWEHLQSEKQDIADQQKEVMAEAKGCGYDTKVMRKLIAKRSGLVHLHQRDKDELMEMYEAAILAVEHATLEAI